MRTKEEIQKYQKEWRTKNKKHITEYNKSYSQKWYKENCDRLRPIRKKWEESNKDKRIEIKERFFSNNPEKKYKYADNYRKNSPNKWKATLDKYRNQSKYVYGRLKSGAKRRNLDFKITLEDVKTICSENCFYCNDDKSISIDRVDNEIGYIEGNCVSCCTMCNMMKKNFTKDDFLEKVKQIFNNIK